MQQREEFFHGIRFKVSSKQVFYELTNLPAILCRETGDSFLVKTLIDMESGNPIEEWKEIYDEMCKIDKTIKDMLAKAESMCDILDGIIYDNKQPSWIEQLFSVN